MTTRPRILLALSMLAVPACSVREGVSSADTPIQSCPESARDSGETARLVAAARAFLATLTPARRAHVVQPFIRDNAIRWSNFPPALMPRAGLAYAELDTRQTAAANAVIRAAAGACGFEVFDGNRAADGIGETVVAYLSPGDHYISFNGAPSLTKPWMMMAGGHHLGFNFVLNARESGATPMLVGSDPARFTDPNGVIREPLARQSAALRAVARVAQNYPDGRYSGVFTDLLKSVVSIGEAIQRIDRSKLKPPPPLLRPGVPSAPPERYWESARATRAAIGVGRIAGSDLAYPRSYPTTGRGAAYARLTPQEQQLVREAIRSFTALAGRRISDPLLSSYLAPDALAQTYIGMSGDPGLEKPNGYVRIDGPRVWIEMSVQASLLDPAVVHFHALWRDKVADYGGQFR